MTICLLQAWKQTQQCSCFNCGTLSLPSGYIGAYYNNNVDCQWWIAPPGAASITLSFQSLMTQRSLDIIRVYECRTLTCTSYDQIAALSGSYLSPQNVTSSTGFMFVWFTSDSSVRYPGFTATWAVTTPPGPLPPVSALASSNTTTVFSFYYSQSCTCLFWNEEL
jgi:hypothetical protein